MVIGNGVKLVGQCDWRFDMLKQERGRLEEKLQHQLNIGVEEAQ
jgi:hypothetical protein